MDGIYVQGNDITIEQCIVKVNVESGIKINRSHDIAVSNVISDGNTAILGVTAGIHVIDSSSILIQGTTCSLNYGFGILFETFIDDQAMHSIEISDCYIDSNNNGIVMKNVDAPSVENSIIQHNTNGVYLVGSEGGTIKNCRFFKNTYGAFLSDSDHIMVNGSDFDKNENAIYLDSTNGSTIRGNRFTNGTWHAVTIDTWLGMGPGSSMNTVYWNEFRDNGPAGCQVMDNGIENRWHKDGQGNIWHDHPGPDIDNDTIVDEPYEIQGLANSTDPYPVALVKELEIDDDDQVIEDIEKKSNITFWVILSIAAGSILLFIILSLLTVHDGSDG
jgi:parallel beta-helix repeat protein